MSSYQPLKTLLTVKRAAEEAAARDLASETVRCAAAEVTQRHLDDRVEAGRNDLRRARARGASTRFESVAMALERERFRARLTDEVEARRARADAHRDAELAVARTSATRASTAHRAAREAREIVDRLCAQADAAVRQVEARREEMAHDQQGQDALARVRGQNQRRDGS